MTILHFLLNVLSVIKVLGSDEGFVTAKVFIAVLDTCDCKKSYRFHLVQGALNNTKAFLLRLLSCNLRDDIY